MKKFKDLSRGDKIYELDEQTLQIHQKTVYEIFSTNANYSMKICLEYGSYGEIWFKIPDWDKSILINKTEKDNEKRIYRYYVNLEEAHADKRVLMQDFCDKPYKIIKNACQKLKVADKSSQDEILEKIYQIFQKTLSEQKI